MTQAFPLQWPMARPRNTSRRSAVFGTQSRQHGKQDLTVRQAMQRLQTELDRLGAGNYVLSTNVETKLNGEPRSGREPGDPGAALYFDIKGKPYCMPCDTYSRLADNIAAIAKHIEATRAIERYGVASLSEMFAGFAALPPPKDSAQRPWREVLGWPDGFQTTLAGLEVVYRAFAKERHPDRPGGSTDAMAELNRARADAIAELFPEAGGQK